MGGFESVELEFLDDCGVAALDGSFFSVNDDFTFSINDGPVFIAVEVALITDAFSGFNYKFLC